MPATRDHDQPSRCPSLAQASATSAAWPWRPTSSVLSATCGMRERVCLAERRSALHLRGLPSGYRSDLRRISIPAGYQSSVTPSCIRHRHRPRRREVRFASQHSAQAFPILSARRLGVGVTFIWSALVHRYQQGIEARSLRPELACICTLIASGAPLRCSQPRSLPTRDCGFYKIINWRECGLISSQVALPPPRPFLHPTLIYRDRAAIGEIDTTINSSPPLSSAHFRGSKALDLLPKSKLDSRSAMQTTRRLLSLVGLVLKHLNAEEPLDLFSQTHVFEFR